MNSVDNNSTLTKDSFLVQGLEAVQPAYAEFQGKMFAGRIPFTNGERSGKTMFWLFEPDTQEVPDTLVVWLNGGPGCSSFNCGVMMEHSPVTQPLHSAGYCCLEPTPELSVNEHAWTRATTMLYVEHPVGTGFSEGQPLPEDETDASGDLYEFIQNFYQVFDHFQKYKIFIMGESYAGMFVPSIVRYFHRMNVALADNPNGSSHIHLHIGGGSLGNGWIDAKVQGPATIDYSWWHGMIDKPTRDALHAEWKHCIEGPENAPQPPPFHPFTVQDDCGIMWGILQAAGQPNAYDVTTWDPNVDQITFTSEAFYNSKVVKAALHAPEDIVWHGCQGFGRRRRLTEDDAELVRYHRRLYMDNDRPLSMAHYMEEILDAGIPLLVYNGDRDMTTNMVGTELVLNNLTWSHGDSWMNAPRGLWMAEGYEGGWAKELGPLTFVVVYNSGHMVPYNQPVPSYDLLKRFLRAETFVDSEMPQVRFEADKLPSVSASLPIGASIWDSSSSSHGEHGLLAGGGSFSSKSLDGNYSIFVALVAFVLGASVSYFMTKPRRQRHQRYSLVPDATMDA